MGSKFDDYVQTSKRASTKDSRERRAVFARAYTIAMQLVTLREKRGLTQKELAARLGTTQSAIARLEAGNVAPSLPTLDKVAAALGVELVVSFVDLNERIAG